MSEQVFPAEGPVRVHITDVSGDVEVIGWSEARVSLVADDDEMPYAQWNAGQLEISRAEDMRLRVPQGSQVQLDHGNGDASFNGIAEVSIGTITGDAEFQNVGNLNFGQVSGDCAVRNVGNVNGSEIGGDFEAHRVANTSLGRVNGDAEIHGAAQVSLSTVMGDLELHEAEAFTAGQVFGDVALHGVANDVNIENVRGDAQIEGASQVSLGDVHGDLVISEARGALNIRHVNGDVRLQHPAPGLDHIVRADGDVALGLTPGPVRLNVRAHGSIRWDRALGLTVQNEGRRQFEASAGEGGGLITVSAHGDVAVYVEGDERGRRGRGRWAVAGATVPAIPPIPPIPPVPPVPALPRAATTGFAFGVPARRAPQVSAEERTVILQMLAEGKISADQAARLLDALGG